MECQAGFGSRNAQLGRGQFHESVMEPNVFLMMRFNPRKFPYHLFSAMKCHRFLFVEPIYNQGPTL